MSSTLVPSEGKVPSPDIPLPDDGDDVPSAGDVPVRPIDPSVDPSVTPVAPDIDTGGNQDLIDRTTPEYEFKRDSFLEQQVLIESLNTYATVEIIMIVAAFLIGWIPLVGKLPSFILVIIAFVFCILRQGGSFDLDSFFLDRDNYLTPNDYDFTIQKMILSYDTLRDKYTNISMGIIFDVLLLINAFAGLVFWFIEWHPYFIGFKAWTFFLSVVGIVSPAMHLGDENWYPLEFDKTDAGHNFTPNAGDFGK